MRSGGRVTAELSSVGRTRTGEQPGFTSRTCGPIVALFVGLNWLNPNGAALSLFRATL